MTFNEVAKSSPILPISVVIPAYNASKYLREAINSVLSQTVQIDEIIVINDGSTDDTEHIARELGAVIINQNNKGLAAARNAGINKAKNNWIALLDADDIWLPTKLEIQWKAICSSENISLVCCDHTDFDDNENILRSSYLFEPGTYYEKLTRKFPEPGIALFDRIDDEFWNVGNFLSPSTVIFNKTIALETGLFNTDLKFVEDVEFFLRLLNKGSLAVVEQPLVKYRIHSTNWSKNDVGMTLGFLEIVEMLRSSPEKYPKGALEAWSKDVPDKLRLVGLHALKEGRKAESRSYFSDLLKLQFSFDVVLFWIVSFFPRSFINLIHKIKNLNKD